MFRFLMPLAAFLLTTNLAAAQGQVTIYEGTWHRCDETIRANSCAGAYRVEYNRDTKEVRLFWFFADVGYHAIDAAIASKSPYAGPPMPLLGTFAVDPDKDGSFTVSTQWRTVTLFPAQGWGRVMSTYGTSNPHVVPLTLREVAEPNQESYHDRN